MPSAWASKQLGVDVRRRATGRLELAARFSEGFAQRHATALASS